MADSDDIRTYEARTGPITVRVASFYLEDESQPQSSRYVWAYRVNISNSGPATIQLLARSWRITDGRGRVFIVHGDGVVGEQPVLAPGEAFEYTSGTPLETPSGFMAGEYHMRVHPQGTAFDAAIPAFSLDSPHQDNRVH